MYAQRSSPMDLNGTDVFIFAERRGLARGGYALERLCLLWSENPGGTCLI